MANHVFMGGKLHIYKREDSSHWQCSTYLNGRNWRRTTGEESLERARDVAEDWYLGLKGKHLGGLLKTGKTFKVGADQFMLEYPVITEGQRNAEYVAGHKRHLRIHILPFIGSMLLSEITAGKVQEYRVFRMQKPDDLDPAAEGKWKPPTRSTLHKEIVVIRQVLKTAQRHGWISHVPDLSPPYKTSGKITHRAWFSPEEYKQLYEATRRRSKDPLRSNYKRYGEQLHDYVLFMANTGLRPDEANRLEYRDVNVVKDAATDEIILEIEVRGKRGVGYCKSMPGAVRPFQRMRKRENPQPTDRLVSVDHRGLFNNILAEEGLKFDRDGNRRTAYSLRHTYICMRLMEGADIYQVAKNCRTSVEMIEKHYAVHLKNRLDAAAINVRKDRSKQPRRAA